MASSGRFPRTAKDRNDQGKAQIPVYGWELLPAEIAEPIDAYLGLPVHRMTATEEGKVTEIRSSASWLAEELADYHRPKQRSHRDDEPVRLCIRHW